MLYSCKEKVLSLMIVLQFSISQMKYRRFQSLGHIKRHKREPMLLKTDVYTCKYTLRYGLPGYIKTKQEQSCFTQIWYNLGEAHKSVSNMYYYQRDPYLQPDLNSVLSNIKHFN